MVVLVLPAGVAVATVKVGTERCDFIISCQLLADKLK
jgi:phosphoribosylcarboxyaminoimidazole (NCAIR) mutase